MKRLRAKTRTFPRALIVLAMFCSPVLTAKAQTLNATSIAFGNVVVQTTSTAKTVTLSNTQTVPLTINSISVSGDFAETSKCPIAPNTLSAGKTCQILVTFTPSILATESGTLAVNDNASTSPQTAQLSGVGVPPVGVTPSTLKYGNQVVNTTSTPRIAAVFNYQTVPLTIVGISVTGDFITSSNCPLSPNTLAARSGCNISVMFTPTAVGTRTGTLTVSHNAANTPQSVQLSGTGLLPVVLAPSGLGMGNQFVNTTSVAKVVTLTNDQTVPLGIASISTSGDFAQTSNCPLSPNKLAANSSCTISVTLTPTSAGARSGVLTVNDDAPTNPQTASLTGTGVLPVTLSATSLPFLSQLITTTSAPKTVTVKNSQSNGLTISGISISGDFAQTSNCPVSPNTLAAGSSCTISVTFTPIALGTRSGTLTISDSASTSPQTASLSGTGSLSGLSAISITPLNLSMFTGSQQQLAAIGTFPNNKTINISSFVNWSSSAPAFAPVSSTGLVQALAAGAATISASSGSVVGQTTVSVAAPALTSITVTPINPSLPLGAYQQFTAVLNYSDGSTKNSTTAVSWSSSSNAVATVSPSGFASPSSVGSTTIQASLGSITGSTTLTVSQPSCTSAPAGLVGWWTGDGNTVDIAGNNSGTLQNGTTYGSGEVAQAFSFSGSGASLLINSPIYSPTTGTLTFWFLPTGAAGALTGSYAGAQNRAPGFSIDSAGNLNWEFGNLFAQSLGQVSPNQWYHVALTYSTSSSGTTVSVYLNGVLVADTLADANTSWNLQVAFGAYLGATQPSFSGSIDEIAIFNQALTSQQIQQIYNAFSAGMCKPTLQSISVIPANSSLAPGLSLQFDALGSYSDSTTHDLTTSANWSTADTTVATINASGLATTVANGNTTISAELGSILGSASVTVAPTLVSIQVSPQNPLSAAGTVQSFAAIGTFNDGSQQDLTSSVSWSSSAPASATIASNGIATCVAVGQTTITATAGSLTGSTLLNVTSATLVSIAVGPANPSISAGTTQQFTATGTFSDGSQQDMTASVNWSSSAPTLATIASNGVANGLAFGQVTITATFGSVFNSASLTVTSPTLASIAVNPMNPSVLVGGTQLFTATGTYSDGSQQDLTNAVTWASSNPSVATVGPTGLATSTSVGSTTISATLNSIVGSSTLTVAAPAPILTAISVSPVAPSLLIGQNQQLSASGTYSDGSQQDVTSSVLWSSTQPSVGSTSGTGLVSALSVGTTTINAVSGAIIGSTTLSVRPTPASFTTYSTTWNNLPRQYSVYVPKSLPANPSMVLYLHDTATSTAGPSLMISQWEAEADNGSFLMVWPISTVNTRSGSNQYYWSAYYMDYSFIPAPAPDDVGFIRNVIVTVTAQYGVNPKAVYVTGMSSGALMTQRVGVEVSDLVAAIAPVSGPLQARQMTSAFAPAAPLAPISVLELHGDADPTMPYCGGSPITLWGETALYVFSVDETVNYWLAADGLSANATPLCTNGLPTAGVNGVDEIGNGVEVNFVREPGVGHVWPSTAYATVWNFFGTHSKP